MDLLSVANLVSAQDCFANDTFMENWQKRGYREKITKHLGSEPAKEDMLSLGSKLSSMFSSEGATRDQGNVSSAGNTWLRLVCWYLNLCLIGTRSFATISSDLIPARVNEAMKLKFNGDSIAGSKEIVVIEYVGSETPTVCLPATRVINYRSIFMNTIKDFLNNIKPSDTRVIMVAAKTNCSDMVAVPLFWAFCYKGNRQDVFDIKVGTSESNPEMLVDGALKYAYVTVPTGRPERVERGQIPGASTLKKLNLLDGGFYWGRPASNSVKSISEFFKANLPLSESYAGETVACGYQRIVSGESPMSTILNP